ncbi:MAG: ATP cone domain-containing protein [Bacteroidota bacterium]|nr:ATP cone domain-containing protein [Bacteroidota bacterium]
MKKDDHEIRVRKNAGELVPFETQKLQEALQRSGASTEDIRRVTQQVKTALYDGITTRKIYQIAYSTLKKLSYRSAGRFKLKKALFELGPSGYPFEFFVAKLLELDGCQVKTGQIIQGKCVQHEVDVVAEKAGKLIMAECKFHHAESAKSDVKTSLYVRSRFNDIYDKLQSDGQIMELHFEPMLITNTRFTLDALQYGICSGLKMLSWDHPQGNSLKDWIDRSGFHPITVLKSLTKKEKKILMGKGIVLCREILEKPDQLNSIEISQRKKNNILKEARALTSK